MTKALGFNSNLELDPRSKRTRVGPKISTVTVVKDGTKVEKWHVNYFTQFDSMLIASQWGGGWQLLPPSLADAMYFKRLATQFGAFLDSQQTLYDDYLGLQSGPFKSAINKLDQFFDKYQYGISVRFNYIDILWMDEKSPGFVNYHNSNRYNNLMIRFGESRNGLQELLRSSRDHMNDNSIYTEDYLEAFRMIGWSTHKADNELVLKPDGNAIKLAKQWGL